MMEAFTVEKKIKEKKRKENKNDDMIDRRSLNN